MELNFESDKRSTSRIVASDIMPYELGIKIGTAVLPACPSDESMDICDAEIIYSAKYQQFHPGNQVYPGKETSPVQDTNSSLDVLEVGYELDVNVDSILSNFKDSTCDRENYCPDKQTNNQYNQQQRYSRYSGAKKTSIENDQEEEENYKKCTFSEATYMEAFKLEIFNSAEDGNIVSTNSGNLCDGAALTTPAVVNAMCTPRPTTTNVSSMTQDIGIKASKASNSSLPHIMAGIILNYNFLCEMEIDTAADNCIIPQNLFDEMVSQSGDNPPILQRSSVTMKLADGSPSNSVKGSTLISIARADMPDKTGIFRVFVVDGPHILLGRPVLCDLWPSQYDSWLKAADGSIKALGNLPMAQNVETSSEVNQDVDNVQFTAATTTVTVTTQQPHLPTTRPIPPPPTGEVTQEMGEAYCKQLCDEVFPELFSRGQGTFKGVTAKIHLKEGAEKYLKVFPPAKPPHGIKPEYDEELDKMYETGNPVDGRGLLVASQIVPVVKIKKGKKKVRLCTNYKKTINDHIEDEPYPFPTCNEQIGKLKGDHYSCLDIEGAFTQIVVDPPSRKYLTATSPRGFIEPTRLPFGVKTAPKIFQSAMDNLLHGMNDKGPIPSTACIVDDICTTGSNPQEHFANLTELLSRLHAAGLKLNKEKCKFYQPSVKFLGKIINKNGQHIDPDAVSAIVNMPVPVDKSTLRSFLGHMSYIGKHVSDVRVARAPLDTLLKADVKFIWEEKHTKAFEKCKKAASNSATLAHFDVKLPVVLTTDASPVGLGACLSHRITENGKSYLKPVSYASCSLKAAEKNYA